MSMARGDDAQRTHQYTAIIIGAGFAGLYMLHRLKQLGWSAVVLETAPSVGGTWYWNRYPGARCDVESLQYSYSFDDDLQQQWHWSERYATQQEILTYLNHVADRFDLRGDIELSTRVERAHWDAPESCWRVTTEQGQTYTARFVITAMGCLSVPRQPRFDGVDDFAGDTYLTAQWPTQGVDLSGQRVAVIGTGSSGIQITPVLARQAKHLTVFQRSPNYVLPAFNRPMDPTTEAEHKADYDRRRQKARQTALGIISQIKPQPSALAVAREDCLRSFQQAWNAGGNALAGVFNDVTVDPKANELAAEFVRDKIRATVKDSQVAEVLTPRDHPIFGRRPCVDTDFYATFNRDNVTLVDLRATPIEAFVAEGIKTTDATYEFDAVVFATGFDAITGALLNIDIRGLNGQTLRDKWADGPRTYPGVMTAGFPNLFMITGPGSPSVLSNVVVSIEQHVEWITDLLKYIDDGNFGSAQPTDEAETEWSSVVNDAAKASLLGVTPSWYSGSNVDGKPEIFMPYSGGVGRYRQLCGDLAARGYPGIQFQ